MGPVFAALTEGIIERQSYALLQEGREMDVEAGIVVMDSLQESQAGQTLFFLQLGGIAS